MKPLTAPFSHFPLYLLASFHNGPQDQPCGHTIQNSSYDDISDDWDRTVNEGFFLTISWHFSRLKEKQGMIINIFMKQDVEKILVVLLNY